MIPDKIYNDLFDFCRKDKQHELSNLLKKYPDININRTKSQGFTPLMYSCASNYKEIVKILLSRKDININQRNFNYQSSLNIACRNNNIEIVEILLDCSNSSCRRGGGLTSGSGLTSGGDIDVNSMSKYGDTPLIYSLNWIYGEITLLLLKHPNIDINKVNNKGQTALMIACAQNKKEMVSLLIHYGADFDKFE